VLASYGGVIADRYQRTTVMIVSSLTAAVLMAGMAVVVATDAPVVWILVLLALSAAALAPYRPASGALIPEIVGEKDLAAANSIFAALENLVVVLGPGIGGLLLLTDQPVIGVAINGVSFVIAAGLIARLRVRSTGGARDGNALQQWVAGLTALRAQPVAVAVILFCASTPPSMVRAQSFTYHCRSRWAPVPAATATCWPERRLAVCSPPSWRTG